MLYLIELDGVAIEVYLNSGPWSILEDIFDFAYFPFVLIEGVNVVIFPKLLIEVVSSELIEVVFKHECFWLFIKDLFKN